MYLIGAASSAGAATMIVRSRAPASSRVLARPATADGGHALPDRDVDRDDARVLVVDDRVERDRRLAGLAVADDQLALAAADRDHRVDRLEAGLHRLRGPPGALNSAGRVSLVMTSPLPSSGLPSGSTMRPRRASPTGISSSLPVRLTV